MAFISWEDSFSVGVRQFDEEHKQLLGFINKLHVGLLSGDGHSAMAVILDGLALYAAGHFSHEEKLMVQHAYPGYEDHKNKHDDFVKKVADFRARFAEGRASFSLELMSFLKEWLVSHIRGVDMNYRAFFTGKGIA